MKKLVNELTWSVSRANLFRTCPRAYYFNYYGSWGGWEANAPERTRQLYMLKQIKTLPMWAGTIVHDTIKTCLTQFAHSNGTVPFPTVDDLQNRAILRMRSDWREAVAKLYEEKPKATNLHELFYGNGKTLPKEVTDDIKARVLECMEYFAASPVVAEIKKIPPVQWKPIDTLDTFNINDLKVWCAVDFAYVDDAGTLHIIDWKTGAEHVEELRLQLACYALFAMDKWHASLDKIALQGVFLRDGGRGRTYPINPESLVTAKDQILMSSNAMRSKIKDIDNNLVDEEDFPCNVATGGCERCCFRKVCPAFADQP